MKNLFTGLFVIAAVICYVLGEIPFAIFAAMFGIILFMMPAPKKSKTPEELLSEANGGSGEMIFVEYEFNSNKGETFTVNLHHESTIPLTEAEVLNGLTEYVFEHTGIPVESSRLHVLRFEKVQA